MNGSHVGPAGLQYYVEDGSRHVKLNSLYNGIDRRLADLCMALLGRSVSLLNLEHAGQHCFP